MKIFIYALKTDGHLLPFYIGRTNDLVRRKREHRRRYRDFTMEVIETCGADWPEREHHWIEHFRSAGARLTNKTEGGDGCQRHCQSTRDRLSRIKRGKPKPPGFGERLSATTKGRPHEWTEEGKSRAAVGQFKIGVNFTAGLSPEVMAERSRKLSEAASAIGFEARSARVQKLWATLTPEQRSARGQACAEGRRRAAERRREGVI